MTQIGIKEAEEGGYTIRSMKRALQDMATLIRNAEAEARTQKSRRREVQAESDNLNKEIKRLNISHRRNLEEEIEKIKAQHASKTDMMEKDKLLAEGYRRNAKRLRDKYSQKVRELTDEASKQRENESILQEVTTKVSKLTGELDKYKQEVLIQKQKGAQAEGDMKQLETRMSNANELLKSKAEQYEAAERILTGTTAALDTARQERDHSRQECDHLKQDLLDVNQTLAVSRASQAPESSQDEPESAQSQAAALMRQLDAIKGERDLANERVKALQNEKSTADKRVIGLETSESELEATIIKRDSTITVLGNNKSDLEKKVGSLEEQVQSLERNVAELHESLKSAAADMSNEKEESDAKLRMSEQELEEEVSLRETYSSEADQLRSEIIEVRKERTQALTETTETWSKIAIESVRSFNYYLNIPMETFGPVFDRQSFDIRSGNVAVSEAGPSLSRSLASQWVGYGLEYLELPREEAEAEAEAPSSELIDNSEVAQPFEAAGNPNTGESESTQDVIMTENEEHVFSSESSSHSDEAQKKSVESEAIEEAELIQEAMSQPDIGVEICELLELFWADFSADVIVMIFAQLSMRLAPERNQQTAWLKLSSALTKFHLIYQSILQSKDLDSPEILWVGVSLLLSVHSMARFENDKAWIAYLDLYLSKQDFDSMGSFSKAYLALLVTTTCEREDSAQLLPAAIYDEVSNLDTTDILSIYKHLRQSDQDGDFFEQTLGEKTFSVVVTDGAKIVLVKQKGAEGYTALLGDPKVTVDLATWSFSWSKEYTMKYNNNMHLGDAPGLSEMSTIFRDAYGRGTYTPRRSKVPEIMKGLAELEEWTKDVE